MNAIYNPLLKPFNFSNLDEIVSWNCTHNGHSVVYHPLRPEQPDVIEFVNDGNKEAISLVQFHFHWGENNYQGSEHYIDGHKYAAEVFKFSVCFLLKIFTNF
jgi:hypothetical protein